jgi:hypothetical protein
MRTIFAAVLVAASMVSGVSFADGNRPFARPLKQQSQEPVSASSTQQVEVPKISSWQRPL